MTRMNAVANMTAFTVKGLLWEQGRNKTQISTTQCRQNRHTSKKFVTYSETETGIPYTRTTEPKIENLWGNGLPYPRQTDRSPSRNQMLHAQVATLQHLKRIQESLN